MMHSFIFPQMKWSFNASWHADMKTAPHSSERLGTEGNNDTLCAFSMVGVFITTLATVFLTAKLATWCDDPWNFD